MSTLINEIQQKAQKAKTLLESLDKTIIATVPNAEINTDVTVSNTNLLLEALLTFYSDTRKAEYLPYQVDKAINNLMEQLISNLSNFNANKQMQYAKSFIQAADQLYAVCLQFGIITFGFGQKELNEIITELRSRRKNVRKIAEELEKEGRSILEKSEVASKGATEKFAQDTKALREELDKAVKECAEEREALKDDIESSEKARLEFDERHAAVVKMADTLLQRQDEAKAAATDISETVRSVKTELEGIKDLRAKAKDEMEEIIQFYGEIEDHQKTMLDVHKEASAKYNELSLKYDAGFSEFTKNTNKLVEENITLQLRIKEHLQKAVGISLFSAFDQRRHGLCSGKWVWAVVMMVAVGLGAWLSFWLSKSLGSAGVEPAFFVKLSAVIPITFAIIFAAKQYSNERRTEEEYAFKSAISVSLEPYKDLLQRMKESGHEAQAVFVEKLLLEIFDNPVKRVYADGKAPDEKDDYQIKLKELKKILAMSKNIDPDKARKLYELFNEISGMPIKQDVE